MKNIFKLIFSIFVCFLPGITGGYFTSKNLYPWYELIKKPFFTPPDWVFSPVWTILYILMGISLFLILNAANSKQKKHGIIFFAIQLVLNGLWSIVFFGLRSILGAFIIIIFLLAFIILTIFKFYQVSKPAGYILIPYLIWVSYATVLNFYIYQLN